MYENLNFKTLIDTGTNDRVKYPKRDYLKDLEQFLPYVNKWVVLEISRESHFGEREPEFVEGKIIVAKKKGFEYDDNKKEWIEPIYDIIALRKKYKKTSIQYLTAGLQDGYFATLTVRRIAELI
jgi:hypothetical protein